MNMNSRTIKIVSGLIMTVVAGVAYVEADKWLAISSARRIVSNHLLDPSSTLFRNEKLTSAGWHCGEVNSKNRAGNYDGYKRFFSDQKENGTLTVDGTGIIGRPETTAEIAAVLKIATDRARAYNSIRSGGLQVQMPTQDKLLEIGRSELFEANWRQHCT